MLRDRTNDDSWPQRSMKGFISDVSSNPSCNYEKLVDPVSRIINLSNSELISPEYQYNIYCNFYRVIITKYHLQLFNVTKSDIGQKLQVSFTREFRSQLPVSDEPITGP